jgi:hypothetical protein
MCYPYTTPAQKHFDMTKGQNSKNSLKALAHPIQQFLSSWGAREKPSTPKINGAELNRLPVPYELAALRGEGILRDRFFNQFMAKLPVALDASQQIAAWHTLVEGGGHITAWVERLCIAKALRREALLPLLNPADASLENRKLYTLLLDTLHTQAPELLPWAFEGYFWHCWKQQFPSENDHQGSDPNKTNITVMCERLERALRKQYGNGVELKESFTQETTTVHFVVLWRTTPHAPWQTLHQLERPRLKTARLAAYSEAIDQLDVLTP